MFDFGFGDHRFHGGIEQRGIPFARRRDDAAQHQQTFDELTAQGYRLIAVSTYGLAGVLRFASIWEQAGDVNWQTRHGITAARYQREFNLLGRKGYRLVAISGSGPG